MMQWVGGGTAGWRAREKTLTLVPRMYESSSRKRISGVSRNLTFLPICLRQYLSLVPAPVRRAIALLWIRLIQSASALLWIRLIQSVASLCVVRAASSLQRPRPPSPLAVTSW